MTKTFGTLRKVSREFWHVAPRGFPAVNALGRPPGDKKEVIGFRLAASESAAEREKFRADARAARRLIRALF